MHQISVKDFPGLDLGDKRRDERFVHIINQVTNQPGSSIPKQSGSWYNTKATYEFFKSEQVSLEALQKAIMDYGRSSLGEEPALLIAHDFCQISYEDLQAEGLGYLASKEARGVITYNSIAISEEGVPLSLIYQQSFVRPMEQLGKAQQRKKICFEDKESYYWYEGIKSVNEQLGESVRKIHIADREADIYELFFCAYEANTELLIRSTHPRKLKEGSELWDTVSAKDAVGRAALEIPDKNGKKQASIEVEIRYQSVEILRPSTSKNQYASVEMTAIEIRQISPRHPWQEEVVHWRLLTTLSVANTADALQCVKWYCFRWLIERFHYILKSGTRIEELQLHTAERLQKAIHVYSIAAMRIMQMVYLSRHSPDISCELVLTPEQWAVLYVLIHKTPVLPEQPPTIGQAVQWIGRLGGHLGRKSDGPPGLKTVWRGYQRVCDAANVYAIMNSQENLGKG